MNPFLQLTFIYDDVTAKWHIRLLWICVCSFHKYYIRRYIFWYTMNFLKQ